MKKALILVPRLDNPGGIANYYTVLKNHLDNRFVYFFRGNKKGDSFLIRILQDYFKFYRMAGSDNDLTSILINTSLGRGGFFRDAFFVMLAPRQKCRIVFFRGWDKTFEQQIEKSLLLKKILQASFLRADRIIVLSSEFRQKLIEWGYKEKILLETTVVDETLLENTSIEDIDKQRLRKSVSNILYLGNVKKEKGVLEVVESVDHYLSKHTDRKLTATIAGSGSMLTELRAIVDQRELPVQFTGYVQNDAKAKTFKEADIYLFPSVHGEGMPNSVLEAMAFGLPILTTRVGGIPDFFQEGKMGYFLDTRDSEHIAEQIEYLLKRPELMKQMSHFNYNYAKEHFYANKVAKRLQNIIESVHV